MKQTFVPRLTRDSEGHLTEVMEAYDGVVPAKVFAAHIKLLRKNDRRNNGTGYAPLGVFHAYEETVRLLEKTAAKVTAEGVYDDLEKYLIGCLDSIFWVYYRDVVEPARKKEQERKEAEVAYTNRKVDRGTICTMSDCIHLLSREEQRILKAYMVCNLNATEARRKVFGISVEHKKAFNIRLYKALLHLAKTYAANFHVRGDLRGGMFEKLFKKIGTRVVFVEKEKLNG